MKKVVAATLLSFGFIIGCGPSYDASESAPVMTDSDITQDIQEAMDSGEIDPTTYGQE